MNIVYVLVMLDLVHRKVNRFYYVLRNCKLLVYAAVVRFFSFIIIIIQLKPRMYRFFFKHSLSSVYVISWNWKGRGLSTLLVSCWASNLGKSSMQVQGSFQLEIDILHKICN